jgi:hypothetical protein
MPNALRSSGLWLKTWKRSIPIWWVRDSEGKVYTVRYEAVNAMLLNEFLKEHRTVQEQGASIAELKKQIETLTAGLQRVSAQLQVNQRAPQTAQNTD